MGVVVPAYDEEALIAATLGAIPPLVDRIVVVNDGSTDRTSERALELGDPRVEVLSHERRSGVGAATVTGYRRALADGLDVVVVMNGDNQMDPEDLPTLVEPVARGELDYSKANRLSTGQAWQLIPKTRFFGNAILSMLTKVASGYWHVADSQSGYTAVSRGDARAARPRPHLHELRLPERHARPPQRLERARARLSVASDLRRRRALEHALPPRRAADRVAPAEGLLLAAVGEVREARLPPARLLLRDGVHRDGRRRAARARRRRLPDRGLLDPDRDRRPRRAARHLGAPVHAVRHVVRHGVATKT